MPRFTTCAALERLASGHKAPPTAKLLSSGLGVECGNKGRHLSADRATSERRPYTRWGDGTLNWGIRYDGLIPPQGSVANSRPVR